jgi:cytochrome c oxidase subunit 3
MMFGWFGTVIRESEKGLYDAQVDKSFRWGMMWFIFSEVMFFAAFFGALYYVRQFALPWLDGAGNNAMTGQLLWPDFSADWPLMNNPNPETYAGQKDVIPAWGVPAINTAILLTSGVTITIAHHMLKASKRGALVFWMAATVALGIAFLYLQAHEYAEAYNELGLTLGSGIYGSTFFMLTGFHGAHVTIGTIMLIVITLRCAKGHFKPDSHFGFEGVAWYWHFVDVVWLGLFIFVYWL